MRDFFSMTPVTLVECLEQMKNLKSIHLSTDGAVSWIIGHYESLSIEKACSLVKEYHIDQQKAFLTIGDSHRRGGVYGIGPDNTSHCLFQILKKDV